MQTVKYILQCIFCLAFFTGASAQNKVQVTAEANSLFSDLTINDPSANSVLLPGEDSIQKIKKNVFVTATISKTRCFVGEPVLVTWSLYTALQSTSTIEQAPSYAGFASDIVQLDNEQVNQKKISNKNYRVFIMQQVQLVPLQEGALIIDPISISNEVAYKKNQTDFHYSGSVAGKGISIFVDPLPVANRPADFSGAMGNFTINVSADSASAAGENNTLQVEISGTGNFNSVPVPEIEWPAAVEHFSVDSHVQIDKKSFPSIGKKIITIPFVPSKQGLLIIPSIQFNFFDTRKKIYRVISSKPVTVRVTAPLQKPVSVVTPQPEKKYLHSYYFVLIIIVVLLFAGTLWYRQKKNTTRPERNTIPAAAESIAEKKDTGIDLNTLSGLNNTSEYILVFKKIFNDQLRQHTGLSAGTEDQLLQQLHEKDTELANEARLLFAECNYLLYASVEVDSATKTNMENKLTAICNLTKQLFTS